MSILHNKNGHNIIVAMIFIVTLVFSLFITQDLTERQTVSSQAQNSFCNNPQGCGGDCQLQNNMGCGYGGCRFWEYCADENNDGIHSCYDTTALGTRQPDFNRACGYARTGQVNPSTVVVSPVVSPVTSPAPSPSPTTIVPSTTSNVTCTQPGGCGGNCNPNQNRGCGFGGCRFWEYCGDDNGDGLFSCHDTTNNGTSQPDFTRACGHTQVSITPPPVIVSPLVVVSPSVNISISRAPNPSVSVSVSPVIPTATYTPVPSLSPSVPPVTGQLDFSKLCMPLEVNGSQADKMDILIFPVNFSGGALTTEVPQLALKARNAFNSTNINQYQSEVLKKMNWYVLNVAHPQFDVNGANQFRSINDGTESGLRNSLFALGRWAQFCGRDRFMIIYNVDGDWRSYAIIGQGAVVYKFDIENYGGGTFVHEWGHAAGGLADEYISGYNYTASNCTNQGSSGAIGARVCSANDTDPSCIQIDRNPAFHAPCPVWDCNTRSCSDFARRVLQNAQCYRGCGVNENFRAAYNSIMRVTVGPGANEFTAPSIVYMVERIFSNYR